MHAASARNLMILTELQFTGVCSVTSSSICKHLFPDSNCHYYLRTFVYCTAIHIFKFSKMTYSLHVSDNVQFISNYDAHHDHQHKQ